MKYRLIRPEDRDQVLAMMRVFYDSPALLQQVSDEILVRDVDACLEYGPYAEGYVFTDDDSDNELIGYSILAKSFSTEAGGLCIWIEDMYLKEAYRHQGYGTEFFRFVEKHYGPIAARIRLEVEADNEKAIGLYQKSGYEVLPYVQMVIDDNELK